jgi:hypothetical protein
MPGISIVERPPARQTVEPGEDEVIVTITTDEPVPGGVITYRTELAESGTPATGRVRRARGSRTFDLAIPVGRAGEEPPANPDGAPSLTAEQLEPVYVVTSVGAFPIDLIPALPIGGTYAGEVSIPEFGQFGLPLEFQVVTDPEGASLEDADTAWLVLPVSPTRVFSPFEAGNIEQIAAELSYDDFIGRWVATFQNRFGLASDSLLGGYPDGQIERSLRIEIEPLDGETIIGRLSDRWTGFYDILSTDGVADVAVNAFQGEITATRFIGAVSPSEAARLAIGNDEGDPQRQPLPPLDACTDAMLAVDDLDLDVTFSCAATTALADFELATVEVQASCAIAVAETALAGETTSAQIAAFLDDSVDNPGGLSFSEFMENCAAGTDGTCVPSDEVICGRQLVAYAYANQDAELDIAPQLVTTYTEATREAFLGRQLGAFQTDSDMRLAWLRTTDYPAIVTTAVQDLNERLLNEWVDSVLEVHLEVLAGQFDASGLSVLSRAPSGEAARALRQQLLLEMSQSWRASMDALTLAAARWHTLYQGAAEREDAAAFVSTLMFDLYILSSVLSDLNTSAGAGFANATFGGGFSGLMRELERLSLPFDKLIYARDGEIVVTRSLDPDSTNDDVLDVLEALALESVDDAAEAVATILAEAEARALDETQLRNRMNNDIENLQDQLVLLCGLPTGCSRSDLGVEDGCEVGVVAGECGFLIDTDGNYEDFDAGRQNNSAAGRAILSIEEAAIDSQVAYEELRAHNARATLYLDSVDAFAAQVIEWNEERRAVDAEISAIIAQDNFRQLSALDEFRTNIQAQAELRTAALDSTLASIEDWNTIRLDGVESDMRDLVAVTALNQTAGGLRDTAESVDTVAALIAEGMPKVTGTSNDFTAPARLAIRMSAYGVTAGMRLVATGMDAVAAAIDNASTRRQLTREAELANLEYLSDLETATYEADVAVLEAELEFIVFENEVQRQLAEDLVDSIEARLELEHALERDLVELDDRRRSAWEIVLEGPALELRALQADLTIQQRLQEYLNISLEASLVAARLADLQSQRANVNRLLGSPGVVFGWANRLVQAETRLSAAKSSMMDWLVALEYFAVRPFMDQRLQILLARNTYQLEAIAGELRRLQRECGGAVNREIAELSVRDDLLDIGFASIDAATEQVYSADDRFVATLERGAIPVDTRVRYTTDSTVGDLVSRSDILAATFQLSLDDFANLATTCNAKLSGIAIALEGEGLGDVRPTVSILYDGTSQLRSCQPNIDEYVASFGPEATTFGSITAFRTAGRAISPVASVGDFGAENTTLAGLPLAASYTVLIDPTVGENANVDWSLLQDVRVRVSYTYQDPFPTGQCE